MNLYSINQNKNIRECSLSQRVQVTSRVARLPAQRLLLLEMNAPLKGLASNLLRKYP